MILARDAEKLASVEESAVEQAAQFEPIFPAAAELGSKADAQACQACGVKMSGYRVSMVAAVKFRCKSCGYVICKACSPTQADVFGHSTPQRVCTPCVEAKAAVKEELEAAATEAEKRCAAAQTAVHTAVIDGAAAMPELQAGSAASFLRSALKEATAAGKQEVAAALRSKLGEVGEKCLVLAIALDAFPVSTIVRAPASAEGAAASRAVGEVVGHTPNGEVEVRFNKEVQVVLKAATLRAAALPDGWAINQTCVCIDELPDKGASNGQAGTVKGWSKPFDCDQIMADFSGVQVNVELHQIEPESEQLESMQLRALDVDARNASQDAAVMEQERMCTSAKCPSISQQPTIQQLLPSTLRGSAEEQDKVRVIAPPGCAAGAVLGLDRNGTEYYFAMPAGITPGQQFLVNLRDPDQIIMTITGGAHVNMVDLNEIEPESVQLVSTPPYTSDVATCNTAEDTAIVEQQRRPASPRSTQQLTPEQQIPSTMTGSAEEQDMVKVIAPSGCEAGDILGIYHNGIEYHITVPTGVSPGQQFLVNLRDRDLSDAEPENVQLVSAQQRNSDADACNAAQDAAGVDQKRMSTSINSPRSTQPPTS